MADKLMDVLIRSGRSWCSNAKRLVMSRPSRTSASGCAAVSATAQTSKITNAQNLIKGGVTEFENKSAGSSTGIGIGVVRLPNTARKRMLQSSFA